MPSFMYMYINRLKLSSQSISPTANNGSESSCKTVRYGDSLPKTNENWTAIRLKVCRICHSDNVMDNFFIENA